MVNLISDEISNWENVPTVDLQFSVVTGLITTDINSGNYNSYFVDSESDAGFDDNINPIIFDDDGEIVQALYGTGAELVILGFAGPVRLTSDSSQIEEGQVFINCRCLDGNPSGACTDGQDTVVFTEDDLHFTVVHEVGHLIGLDHTQVNQSLAEGRCDPDNAGDCDAVPAMYPVSVDPADQISPSRDDEVMLLTLYGDSSWEDSYCNVSGSLVDVNDVSLRCADVQAVTDDPADTIALVAGIYAPASDNNGDGDTADAGECSSNCADFTLRGLDPGKSYNLVVKPIDSAWSLGGSTINPCNSDLPTGIVEETLMPISGCTAGGSIALGTLDTTSDLGQDSGASSGTCGDNQDFSNCDPVLGCGLSSHPADPSDRTYLSVFLLVISFFLSLKTLKRSCKQLS